MGICHIQYKVLSVVCCTVWTSFVTLEVILKHAYKMWTEEILDCGKRWGWGGGGCLVFITIMIL